MDEIRIDRLTLKLSGLSEAEGRRLASLITEGLAAVNLPASAATGSGALRVDLTTPPSASIETLSQLVVADVLRQLERSA